jgi:hypothetical protein
MDLIDQIEDVNERFALRNSGEVPRPVRRVPAAIAAHIKDSLAREGRVVPMVLTLVGAQHVREMRPDALEALTRTIRLEGFPQAGFEFEGDGGGVTIVFQSERLSKN